MLKIDNLRINGVGGIRKLDLKFSNGINLICGPNGVGKTTILECIAHSFTRSVSNILKRHAQFEAGNWELLLNGEEQCYNIEINSFEHRDTFASPHEQLRKLAKKVLFFKSDRIYHYQELTGVEKDPTRTINDISRTNLNGISFEAKKWFISRFLFSRGVDSSLSDVQQENYEIAKNVFSLIDENVKFSTVDTNFEIFLETKQGKVYIEYMSAGFKSIVYIMLGIICEIEYRDKEMRVGQFDGVILIDELDLHLHPHWQSKLVRMLKSFTPKAQIIASTHSPHMMQCVEKGDVISLGFNDNNDVYIRNVESGKYGFKGWTIEEILEDLMGLNSTMTNLYTETMDAFDKALDEENYKEAIKNYKVIEELVNPNNHVLKLLKIQMAGLREEKN